MRNAQSQGAQGMCGICAAVINRRHTNQKVRNHDFISFGPADLEGHVGLDGKHYLLDFSRLFPPDMPDRTRLQHLPYLYQLLRPEFVKTNPSSLCSDAFSTFCDK